MHEQGSEWRQERVSKYTRRFVKHVGKAEKTLYIKSEGERDPRAVGYGEVAAEYNSYTRLRPYLRMPKIRLVDHGTEGRYLVIQNIPGTPLNALLKMPRGKEFQRTFRAFTKDLVSMWRVTSRPMDETQLVPGRKAHQRCLDRIGTLRQDARIKEILDKPVVINGKKHPTLKQILEDSEAFLKGNRERVMCFGHGDEMLQNILSTPGEQRAYVAIDPRSAGDGYYTPAQSANYLIGYTFLYDYEWSASEIRKYDDHIAIVYSTRNGFKGKDKMLRKLFAELIKELEAFGPPEKALLQQYLFSNLMRSYIDEIMPGNLIKTQPNKIAHLALAIELITNLDLLLKKPSYLSG